MTGRGCPCGFGMIRMVMAVIVAFTVALGIADLWLFNAFLNRREEARA